MLLQTNSYIVPKDKRTEHARLLQRFRQCLARLGCEHFEAYEQVGANWASSESTGRFVQLMRFRDRKQQQQVQAAERNDPAAQALIKEFCELINFPYQQQQGLFAVGFYQGVITNAQPVRQPPAADAQSGPVTHPEPGLAPDESPPVSSPPAPAAPGAEDDAIAMGLAGLEVEPTAGEARPLDSELGSLSQPEITPDPVEPEALEPSADREAIEPQRSR